MEKIESKVGLWDEYYKGRTKRKIYSDPHTADLASKWLNQPDIVVIEDWGCGFGGFAKYVAEHQTYVGVDGSQSAFVDKIEDLVTYTTAVDAIHMRHVLEHNQEWRPILQNFLKSFQKRAVLTIFTPFAETDVIIKTISDWMGTGKDMVDISLPYDEIQSAFQQHQDIKVIEELNLSTATQYNIEHIFYLERL